MRFTTRQDALIAVASFGAGLMLIGAHGYSNWSTGWEAPVGGRVLALAGLCAAMLFRRTAPITGLLLSTPASLADVAMGPSLAALMIYGDALYAASLYGPRRAAEWLLGATVSATLLVAGGVGFGFQTYHGAVIAGGVAGVTWASPVLTAMVVRAHRDKAEAERLRAEQVVRLAELDRQGAVNAERARMARELHDVIANHLSAVALHASAVLKVRDLDREGVDRSMRVIRENSVQGLAEMRRMIGLLREGGGDPPAVPRLDGLERLVEGSVRADLTAGLKVEGDRPDLPAAVELAAYRIVQESLTNALKHGGPGHVEVLLGFRTGRVVIDVVSPLGPHGSLLPGSGSGLIGMSERATALNGVFRAGPEDGRWRVHAELPIEEESTA